MIHQNVNNTAISKALYQLLEPITSAGRLGEQLLLFADSA